MANFSLILGFLGVLQALFLPGFLLTRLAKFDFPWLRTLVLACALSLSINYIIVLSLTSLHGYTPDSMRFLLLIELAVLTWSLSHFWLKAVNWDALYRPFATLYQSHPGLSFIAFLVLFGFMVQALSQFGSVFTDWDSVVSWNHWAIEWSNNQFPSGTDHYPQLLPINFSIPYVLIGDLAGPLKLQVFAKSIALLLPLLPLLAMLDLASYTRKSVYLSALILIALTYSLIYHNSIGAGYADIPVSIMGFIGFYCLILARSENSLYYIVLGTLVCAGAAVTKQAGCYIALLYPVLTYFLYLRRRYVYQKIIAAVLGQYVLLSLIVLPWYLYNQHLINQGLNGSEIRFVTSVIYGNIGLWQRFFDAFSEIKFALYFCLFFSLVHAFYNKEWRICFVLIVLPYLLIWAFLFSYDLRNLALIVPWIGFGAAFGLLDLSSQTRLRRYFERLKKIKVLSILLLLLVLSAVLSLGSMQAKKLQTHELQQERQIGGAVGLWLYQYQESFGLNGKIDTDWQYLAYLPGLSQYYYPDKLTSIAVLQAAMINPGIGYFLTIDDELGPAVKNAISRLIKAKKLQILWHWNDMTFYKVNHE